MKTHITKLIDLYVGGPLCFILSLISPRSSGTLPTDLKRILVIKILGMGSTVVMTPMFRALRNRYPGARIDFLTGKGHSALNELYRFADGVYTVDLGSFRRFFLSTLRVIRKLRREEYDLVIDAEFYSKYTAILSWLVRPRIIAGFHSGNIYRGRLREIRVYFNAYRHMTENFLELALKVGASPVATRLTAPKVPPEALEKVKRLLVESGVDSSGPYILFNPHASEVSPQIDRRWPLEYFRDLARALRDRGYQVIAIDSPGRSAYTDRLAEMSGPAVVRLRREVDLLGLAALFQGSFCLFTNDSGPLHLAVSMGIPTFSFFGTDTPLLYGYDFPPHTIFYDKLACSPCLSVHNFKMGRCEFDSRCLKQITPDRVLASFIEKEEYLREYGSRRGATFATPA